MMRFLPRRLKACAMLVLLAAQPALAQYVWLDEKGVRQYSDLPPPASVPDSRILKRPGGSPQPAASPSDAAAAQASPSAPATLADKEADYRRRRAEQADKEKKAADEARQLAERRKNCDRAREYQRLLDSGERIGRTDEKGEKAYLTDEQRAQEARDVRKVLSECK